MEKSIKSLTIDSKGKQLDFTLLFVVIVLLLLGLVVLSSASSYYALTEFNDSAYYLKKQILFAIIGVGSMIVISKIDYKIFSTKIGYFIYTVGIALMLMVFLPRNRWNCKWSK